MECKYELGYAHQNQYPTQQNRRDGCSRERVNDQEGSQGCGQNAHKDAP
jgi:hypothetical protein